MHRRRFLQAGAALASLTAPALRSGRPDVPAIRKPPRLQRGQTVAVVSPSGATYDLEDLEVIQETMEALGLRVKLGRHVGDRYGYLAGTDEARAADLNEAFADAAVDAIVAIRGGWGAARILPLLDYDLIRDHPKILLGYSDITGLLVPLYARCGLVTFHGPNGVSDFTPLTLEAFQAVLFDAEPFLMRNPVRLAEGLPVQRTDRVRTITPGRARGRLVGGNLTVLTALLGTPYVPADWRGHILFLEDIGEDIYRVDRMMTQLALAGVLDEVEGFVFGKCTRCLPDSGGVSGFTLHEVLADHLRPRGIPAWHGAMIGHLADKFTVPLGVEANIDAEAGTVQLLEPAVT